MDCWLLKKIQKRGRHFLQKKLNFFYRSVATTPSKIIQDKYFAYYSLEDDIALKRLVDHTKLHNEVRAAAYITLNINLVVI